MSPNPPRVEPAVYSAGALGDSPASEGQCILRGQLEDGLSEYVLWLPDEDRLDNIPAPYVRATMGPLVYSRSRALVAGGGEGWRELGWCDYPP